MNVWMCVHRVMNEFMGLIVKTHDKDEFNVSRIGTRITLFYERRSSFRHRRDTSGKLCHLEAAECVLVLSDWTNEAAIPPRLESMMQHKQPILLTSKIPLQPHKT